MAVVVSATCSPRYVTVGNSIKRIISAVPCQPFAGFIIGARRRVIGTRHSGTNGYEGDYNPAYVEPNGTVFVWLVAKSMTNTPVEVLDSDVKQASGHTWPPSCPWRKSSPVEWTQKDKQWMSNESKSWPRDTRGRFLKMNASLVKESVT